jgi:hypothetical protein
MKYSDLKSAIAATLAQSPSMVFHLQSSPGTGKTSLCIDAAREYLSSHNVPADHIDSRILVFRPSIHDPVDLTGTPWPVNGVTTWAPPEMLHKFRKGTGPGVIIWDELPQAVTMMQNAIAGLILDKFVGELHLDPLVAQISTGNRAEDKAGANRLMTQLGNRICILDMEVSLDDVTSYFLNAGIQTNLIAFLRLRPELLNSFDPASPTNPTPRMWEIGAKSIPETLPAHQYFSLWEGCVGEGPAAEWIAARDLMSKMPNPDYCIMQPDNAELPETPAAQYAISTALSLKADTNNFDRAYKYMSRLPEEFLTVFMVLAVKRDRTLTSSRTYIDYALKHQAVYIG